MGSIVQGSTRARARIREDEVVEGQNQTNGAIGHALTEDPLDNRPDSHR